MNSLGLAILLVAVAAANAGLLAGHLAPLDTAAVVSGPSGHIVRSGLVAHPAPVALTHAAPLAYAHAAPIALAHSAVPTALVSHRAAQLGLSLSVPAGSGLEGQWIPDINEKLYDDGTYKPYAYGL